MENSKRLVAGIVGASGALGAGVAAFRARREGVSLSLYLTRTLLGLTSNTFVDADRLRRRMVGRAYPSDAPIPSALLRACEVERWQQDGQDVVTLTPRRKHRRLHVIYLHGGAYVFPLMRAHWNIVAALIEATGARVTVPLYALAPEYDHRRATASADAVYERVLRADPEAPIVLAGDSAGGNFALNLASSRRRRGLSVPDRLLLFSPWLDLSLQDPAIRDVERRDPMLAVAGLRECGRWWAGDADPACPALSPLYGDVADLPPIAIFQGDRDIFVVDARTFANRLRAADALHEYHEFPGAFHVFVGATFTPEAKNVIGHIARLLSKHPDI